MPAPDRRDIVVAFRLTPIEAAHIDAAGKALKLPRGRADYARAIALHYAKQKVPAPSKPIRRPARRRPALDTQILAKLLGQVGKLGNNVNQLAARANANNVLPTAAILGTVAAEVSAIRATLTTALDGGDSDPAA